MQRKVEMQITDIGEIPMEWSTKTLAEIGTFSKGCGVSRDEAMSGDLPCVRYGEIYTNHNDYIKQFTSFISPEVARQSHLMKKGDVLMTCSGETKEDIAKAVAFLDDFEAYAGGDIIIMSPYDEYDPLYLGYILNTASAIEQKASCAQGDSVVHISTDAVKGITIPIPPTKDEQIRIAKALSEMDDLIISLDELIEKKTAIKQGAMQKLLSGETRLKGYNDKWVDCSLMELFEPLSNSNNFSKEQLCDDGVINVIHYGDILTKYGNYLDVENTEIPFVKPSIQDSTTRELINGDIVVADTAEDETVGKLTEIIGITTQQVEAGLHTFVLRPKSNYAETFFGYLLNSFQFHETLVPFAYGTKVLAINKEAMKNLHVQYPEDTKEQKAIAKVLTDMTDEITQLEVERDKYKLIREGMAQQLLTGKIRLI